MPRGSDTNGVKQAIRPIEVLLVESDPAEVVVIKQSFLTTKIINNVRVVENGERALEYLQQRGTFSQVRRPDLLLMNWLLPQMTGFELLQAIRSVENLASLPVAVLSAAEDPREVESARALNASWYIAKPVDGGHLLNMVRGSPHLWLCVVTVPDAEILLRRRPQGGPWGPDGAT